MKTIITLGSGKSVVFYLKGHGFKQDYQLTSQTGTANSPYLKPTDNKRPTLIPIFWSNVKSHAFWPSAEPRYLRKSSPWHTQDEIDETQGVVGYSDRRPSHTYRRPETTNYVGIIGYNQVVHLDSTPSRPFTSHYIRMVGLGGLNGRLGYHRFCLEQAWISGITPYHTFR